jgi:PmbA protein
MLTGVLRKAQTRPVNGCCLAAWRAAVYRTQTLNLGIVNNTGGSVYTPPAFKFAEKADIYLVWQDDKCSRAHVQSPAADSDDDWDQELRLWRLAAFADPFARTIPPAAKLPAVKIASPEIKDLVETKPGLIFDQQEKILGARPPEARTRAEMMALWGQNSVCTSTGIDATYEESRYAVAWSFDSLVGRSFAQRRLITGKEWQELWVDSVRRYRTMQKTGAAVTAQTRVVLAPAVVEQLLEHYILPNFNGENILTGQSKFQKEDFAERKRLGAAGLSLKIDPLRPYHWASYILTAEGIPALPTNLILNGELCSPYLNCKDARRWGADPTAIPYGGMGLRIGHNRPKEGAELLGEIADGILILSVLGLHTQNPVAGDFSLTAPCALRLENGCLTGKTAVRLNGNYWQILQSADLVCGVSELDDSPYLLTNCTCENL